MILPWNFAPPFGFILPQRVEAAMLVERDVQVLNVEAVGEAYDIAAYYLNKTGVLADRGMINDQLLEAIYKLFNSGIRNRLLLANKAISKFERGRR
jgi:hypothetical protein